MALSEALCAAPTASFLTCPTIETLCFSSCGGSAVGDASGVPAWLVSGELGGECGLSCFLPLSNLLARRTRTIVPAAACNGRCNWHAVMFELQPSTYEVTVLTRRPLACKWKATKARYSREVSVYVWDCAVSHVVQTCTDR